MARLADIPRLREIRAAVIENRLSDPERVTAADYAGYIKRGDAFLWEAEGVTAGFSAADRRDGSIWALFVEPAWEGQGIGRALLQQACHALSAAGHGLAWLLTAPNARAAAFYDAGGWVRTGMHEGQVRFELPLPMNTRAGKALPCRNEPPPAPTT